jgi:hypothetical protein
MPVAFGAADRSRGGANQSSCGSDCAIISLAASAYHCQARVPATPLQNVIRKREMARAACLRRDGCPFGNFGQRTKTVSSLQWSRELAGVFGANASGHYGTLP